ncbi:hypothetical protein RKLH11_3227 [Rhodobacteraceae bacterium KLH11]|nr:hypothetical protein RKLH11_3227 [Rhodobacteraceae bacterium KLH11]
MASIVGPGAAKERFEFRQSDWLSMTALATSTTTQRKDRCICERILR